jgi:hypothetical protein
MAARTISLALAGLKVVYFAIASGGSASRADAVVFGAAFCRRSSKAPDVFALPGSAAFVGAPRAPTFARDRFIAPMTASHLTSPLRQHARNPLGNKWWKLQLVNGMFQLLAFCGHGRSQTITLSKHCADALEMFLTYFFLGWIAAWPPASKHIQHFYWRQHESK